MWGDLMALGMVFPIAIALGFFLGRWVGGLLGYPRAGMAVGLVWGVGAGFWELYKVTVRLNRMDEDGQGKNQYVSRSPEGDAEKNQYVSRSPEGDAEKGDGKGDGGGGDDGGR